MTAGNAHTFDHQVDVLVVGAGGGGMTAALTANESGLDTLVVEKAQSFGGSTALSGGGIWSPGAPAQRRSGHEPDPAEVFKYLQRITEGTVTEARLQRYLDKAPEMLEFLEKLSTWFEFMWKPGYADYYPELPGGSPLGSTINVPAIDLRKLGDEEQHLLRPLAMAPKGVWLQPEELRSFYRIRQSVAGKIVLLKLLWRLVSARLFGARMAAIGQSLAARLRLAMRERGIPLWLETPLSSLITDSHGAVIGAVVEREGKLLRVAARGGVILATGGFDHDLAWRKEHLPVLEEDWSFGNPVATGDGIRAGEQVGASTDLLDQAWWFPALQWPDGRLQFMLNERMMPCQFIVNGAGKRFINEASPYTDFGHAMIEGQRSGVTHIPCWLITDAQAWHRYVVLGHLPLPKVPGAPVPTGGVPKEWLNSGVLVSANSWEELATKIDVPGNELRATAERFNEQARKSQDDDYHRGESAYDNYYGDPTLPNPNLAPLTKPPYYAFRIVLGDLGTCGGLRTDEDGRVLRGDDSVVHGLYAVGNTSATVMGRSYAGAGATIGPAMTFGYVAAHHIADQRQQTTNGARDRSTQETDRRPQ